jgi:hypothetical protein
MDLTRWTFPPKMSNGADFTRALPRSWRLCLPILARALELYSWLVMRSRTTAHLIQLAYFLVCSLQYVGVDGGLYGNYLVPIASTLPIAAVPYVPIVVSPTQWKIPVVPGRVPVFEIRRTQPGTRYAFPVRDSSCTLVSCRLNFT